MNLRVRSYGSSGPAVAVLHGGPGAPGYVAPVARGLADAFRVIEPFQRRSGDGPLTVARHVEDLREVLASTFPGERPALVGSSWGAMLALAFAAEHPAAAGPLVLVGSGTFDPESRRLYREATESRMTEDLRRRLAAMEAEVADPDERMRRRGDLLLPLSCVDPVTRDLECPEVDSRGLEETWNDMLRLQDEGVYPAAFARIESPVLMLHGTFDPHPGRAIRDGLAPHLRRLEYREWDRCGHFPWIERAVREEFFRVLREWLAAATSPPPSGPRGREPPSASPGAPPAS